MAGKDEQAKTSAAWQRTSAFQAKLEERSWVAKLVQPQVPRIGDGGLRALENHKYRAGAITPLDRLMYVIWWQPVVNRVPMSLAPNTITLLGAAAAVASCLLSLASAPAMDSPIPAWVEIMTCLLLFFYQTADAIDGMQARRTGAGSPVGELFDHGCDCVCLTASTLGYCASQQCGFGTLTFVTLIVSWTPWYLAQWEAYHTGVVRTGGSLIGITEIELVVVGIHLISAVGGPDIWFWQVMPSVTSLDLKTLCLCIQVGVAGVMALQNIHVVIGVIKDRQGHIAAAERLLPLVTLVICSILWPVTLPSLHLRSFCLAAGGIYARICAELVVCHMTLEDYPKVQPTVIVLPILYLAGLAGYLEGGAGSWIVFIYAWWCVIDVMAYSKNIIEEAATHLGVRIFTVPPRSEKKE